ncbi:hypothetical protein L538_3901 [Bordetella hinzii 4161]|nr:hypothetical protein L538_3901 [Bordetella hinzii 4161]
MEGSGGHEEQRRGSHAWAAGAPVRAAAENGRLGKRCQDEILCLCPGNRLLRSAFKSPFKRKKFSQSG